MNRFLVARLRGAPIAMFVCCAAVLNAAVVWASPAQAHGRWHRNDFAHRARVAVEFPAADALPDPRLTPGAVNPAVTQQNIGWTICRRGGYTRSIRPAEDETERLKRRQVRQYGYARQVGRDGYLLRNYEEDHLIALELGGSPASPDNLWPEPHHVVGGWGSYAKDQLEDRLHRLVCDGRISLASAQRMIATNWIDAYRRYVAPAPIGRSSHRHRARRLMEH